MKLILTNCTLCFQKTNVLTLKEVLENQYIDGDGLHNQNGLNVYVYELSGISTVSIKVDYNGGSVTNLRPFILKNSSKIIEMPPALNGAQTVVQKNNVDVFMGNALYVNGVNIEPVVRATTYDDSVYTLLSPDTTTPNQLIVDGYERTNQYFYTEEYDVSSYNQVVVKTYQISPYTPYVTRDNDVNVIVGQPKESVPDAGNNYVVDTSNANTLIICNSNNSPISVVYKQ